MTYPSLMSHGALRSLLGEDAIREAVSNPPADTRAALRGAFVDAALRKDVLWACDWTHVSLASGNRLEAELLDPFNPEPTEEYLRVMAAVSEPKPSQNW